MVNWNSRMLRRKGQAVNARLEVVSVSNADGVRTVTFAVPGLPADFEQNFTVSFPQPTADDDALPDENDDPDYEGDDDDAKPGGKNKPHKS